MSDQHSDYFIDERGIYTTESRSYPDAIWRKDFVTFGLDDTEQQFEKFVQRVLAEGADRRSGQLRSLLGARGFA